MPLRHVCNSSGVNGALISKEGSWIGGAKESPTASVPVVTESFRASKVTLVGGTSTSGDGSWSGSEE